MKQKIYLVVAGMLCAVSTLKAQVPSAGNNAILEEKIRQRQQPQANGFAENKGQLYDQAGRPNPQVKYLLNMPGLNVQLKASGFSYDTWIEQPAASAVNGKLPGRKFHRVDIELEGSDPEAVLIAEKPIAGSTANVINSRGVFSSILEYGQVTYKDIYPGIDLEFVARQGRDKPIEYNFIVHPGADASQIRMRYSNGDDITLKNGMIEMKLAFGVLKEKIPLSYTQQDGLSLAVQYKPLNEADNLYAFHVPDYDRSKTLVIDPTPSLVWATYFGGNEGPTGGGVLEHPTGLAVDAAGNVLMTGVTCTHSGLATAGAYMFAGDMPGPSEDGFCVKYSPGGTKLWSTYIGTDGTPAGQESNPLIGTDASGNVFLLMQTAQAPTTTGVHSTTISTGNADRYLLKLNPDGGAMLWATYIGASGTLVGSLYGGTMHVLPSGDVLVGGAVPDGVASPLVGFGTGYQQARSGNLDGYVVKINGNNGTGIWGTYFGGPDIDYISSMATDAGGNIYLGGWTASATGIATPGAFQTVNGGGTDMFFARLNSDGSALAWATYYGGLGGDGIKDIAVNNNNQVIISGFTSSASSGMASPGAFQQIGAALLGQFSSDGSRIWATHYLPPIALATNAGYLNSAVNHLAVDEQNNIYISGITNALSNVATSCSTQPVNNSSSDVYVAKFSPAGQRIWGTYYGGLNGSQGEGWDNAFPGYYRSTFAYGSGGEFYVAVATQGENMATPGAAQTTRSGFWEAILAKFNEGEVPGDLSVSAQSISPLSQTTCILGIPAVITGNVVTYTTAAPYASPVFYQWQTADAPTGPWADLPGEIFKDLQPSAASVNKYYRRLVQVSGQYCTKETIDTSAMASVSVNTDIAPIAAADGPQWYVCGSPNNTVTLNGSASGGAGTYTYQWFIGSATTPEATTASYTPAATEATTYTLKITDASGCTDVDQATVVPALANAGPDKSICQGSSGVQIGTAPVASSNISYSWTMGNGTPASATLSCTSCAQPIASPATAATYVLTMTVTRKDNTTCSSTDTVVITPVAAPNNLIAFAGSDPTLCNGATATLGGASADAGFTYTWSPGQYLNDANIYNPVFNPGSVPVSCAVNYFVTATKNSCSFTDEVKVTVINAGITHQNETMCGPLWIHQKANTGNCGEATYSWSVPSGTGTVLQTGNGGASAYLYSPSGTSTFRRTTTVNGVSCTADVLVNTCGSGPACDFDIVTVATQGCPKVFGPGTSFKLKTTVADTVGYNFNWSPANMVDNPTAATVTVTSSANATITCTITNSFVPAISCSESIEVNDPAWSIPSVSFPDRSICYNTASPIGIPPVGGVSFAWSPATGLDNAAISNPAATLTASQTYLVTATETAGGCSSTDTVNIGITPVIAAAGNDRTVCNGATVTLGSPPAVGTNFVYSWQPVGAAWANGTGPGDAQPQVLFATSSQIFTLTVTDTASGCSSTDQVTLSSTLTAGEYAGVGDTVCPGDSTQLGRTAEPFATYDWTLADNSPATGLSCTTCADPILTAPDVTTIYKVKVSYPGCSLPVEDLVTITVLPAPAFDLINQNYCPGTPLAIGFGSTGNPAAPANVASYQWLPATGLSSITVANPTTAIQVPVNYIAKVTYTNGCIRSDSVTITPDAVADAGPDKGICPGESTIIGSTDVPGTSYTWSGNSFVGSSTIAQPTVNPAASTTYSVTVTAGTCTVTDSMVVSVTVPADFSIVGNTTICEGGVATLGLDSAAGANTIWQWAPVTGVSDPGNPNTTIAATDTTTYRLIQTNTITGCSNYKDVIVVVRPNPITAVVTADTSLCAGVSAMLSPTVTPAGSYQYVWTPSAGLSNTYIANPTVVTSFDRTYVVTVTDTASQCQRTDTVDVTIKPVTECYPPVTLSGNIFRDANGLADASVNSSSALGIPAGLYVSLVDSTNTVVNTVAVAAGGAYDFGVTAPGTYRIVLHQTAAGSATVALPAGWVSTGENLNTGVGSDGAINGILATVSVLATNVVNANFGIQQPPVSDPQTYTIDPPLSNQFIPLDSTLISTGPGTSSPDQLTGTDPEDGILDGTGNNKSLVISAAPDYGELWYNGVMITAGEKIINYNPALLSIKITDTSNNTVSFQYAYVDEAGIESAPATYTINWSTPLPITLVDFRATKVAGTAWLQWETAQEKQSNYFVVERSADSKNWQSISRIAAAGNSSTSIRYEHYDKEPLEGFNYYRLKLVSLDGNNELSMIHRLEFNSESNIQVVPNPAHKSVMLLLDIASKEPKQVKLLSMSGRVIRSYIIPAGTKKYPMELSGIAQGVYSISLGTKYIKLVVE